MSYTASKTWISPQTKEIETWAKIRDSITRISPHSPFIPTTFSDWLAHRVAIKEDQLQKVTSKIEKIREREDDEDIPLLPVFGGKKMKDQLALVLAQKTIWRLGLEPPEGRHLAPWPSYDEYKHEGDDRNKSGYSRFPPLPRDPGNATVNWKQRKPLEQFLFDEVGRRATDDSEEQANTADEPLAIELIGEALLLLLNS
ncbi:predicted protein [Uncinocarpus reesii 1704]|uniref:Uncharacterized protein n=1 Tax=Uncinocarpus reesii (strain UAMH 1704) TaxID=336963 RepID=C4JRN9_UNCRE|nr:uncharacterized protein UREG_05128 [Uncinocarpus reesii 1704]EEP80286.1 predicted protein [Uncinocarpus reesii 1704]